MVVPLVEQFHHVNKERFNVGAVLFQHRVAGGAAEQHQSLGNLVDKRPDELAERRRLPFARHLVGDAGCHFGDAEEGADRVVLRRQLRETQMEHIELVFAPGGLRLDVHPQQQFAVALGVEDDNDVAAMDVLGNQHLRHARLADAGGAENDGVRDPRRERLVHRLLAFRHTDGVQPGFAFQPRRGTPRIEQAVGLQIAGERTGKEAMMLAVAVGAGTIITVAEAGKALVLVQLDVVKALRMDGLPQEAHAEKLVF